MISKRYDYECSTCHGQVTKTECHSEPRQGRPPNDYAGLHGWKCNTCGNGVKVKRTLRIE